MSIVIVSRDPRVVEVGQRLAAAAGARCDVVHDASGALAVWPRAPLVLVGRDLADEVAGTSPPRREGVHLVGSAGSDAEVLRAALALAAESVLALPEDEDRLADLVGDAAEPAGRGVLVGVVGGAGGVGATVLACALAQVAARRAPALVVDVDPLGPGVDRILGLEEVAGVRWDSLARSAGRLGARALREAVPRRAELGVLAWPAGERRDPGPDVVREVVAAACRGHDLVVLDLPRHAVDGGARSRELVARCDQVVVVAPATVLGAAATTRLLSGLGADVRPLLAVRSGPVPPADLARVTGLEVVAEVERHRRLDEELDLGAGPAATRRRPLARAAAEVLAALS